MISLYPFQNEIIDRARDELRQHQSVLMVMPCRSGKTVTASKMIQSAQGKGKRIWFIVHRDFLLDQTSKTLDEFSIKHSFIASGRPYNPYIPIQLCSVQSVIRRLDRLEKPDLIITDECHHATSSSYRKYLDWAGAKSVGLTASPIRTNGAGLGEMYQSMVRGPDVSWLIENDFLTKYKAYAPTAPNLAGVHMRAGDYANEEIESIMDGSAIIGDMVRHWRDKAEGMRSLYFGVSVRHSQHIAATFSASGIPFVHIDGDTSSEARQDAARKLARREILGISNCSIAAEGYDLSSQAGEPVSIECVGLARPTKSHGLHIQQSTRSLTPADGKEYGVILDHAGNLMRDFDGHSGLPDAKIEWSLEGRTKKKAASSSGPPVKQCNECFAVHAAGMDHCPYCGTVYEIVGREVEEIAGDLVEISEREALQKHRDFVARKIEEGQCKSLQDWQALAHKRGHKVGWAFFMFKAKSGKQRRSA